MSKSRVRWSEQIGQPDDDAADIQKLSGNGQPVNGQPSSNGRHPARKSRHRLVRTFFALLILLPCMYGFCTKFWELVVICRGDMTGAFAIAPIVNYLLASAGFLLLLGWAAINGMFRDIERPKQTMIEHERWLDRTLESKPEHARPPVR
ncbi:MAG TPA: hypothetical protein VG826_10075 [Pirellulales bacterium]|nr:hypothetical protein [Pirellulales bacterium]